MTDPPKSPPSAKPKILILESNGTICDHVRAILTREGWDVHCENVSKTALQRLEESKATPFNLFISNFKLPKMEGDAIHKHAKAISPMTQRMLMVPADEPDMVIRAINKGGINSCIIYPFQDEDLINQAKHCLAQFQRTMKRQQLKRITQHQNKQLFQIAQKMKKKGETCQKLIDGKKAKILMHRSNLRKALKLKDQNITLGDRIGQNKRVTPESLESEFSILCDYIKALFNSIASKTNLDPVVLNLQSLILPQDQTTLPENNAAAVDAGIAAEAVPSELIQKILKLSLTSKPEPFIGSSLEKASKENNGKETSLNAYFKISISQDKTTASIQRIKGMDLPGMIPLSSLLNYLRDQEICFGIIGDEAIEAWISNLETEKQPFVVARGKAPIASEDGHIKFYFKNDFTNPGKLQSDGTIDFRDRGAIPYVHKGDLLAEKTPAKEGKEGRDVFGSPILVEEALDPIFIFGSGTEIKEENELAIYAAIDGQPHVDAMGNITVNPELMIKGDVDFETGNIDFNGNIIVKGIVKEGFTVKGISLTAQEIEGATIELSGDLYISAGITETTITSVGNVHAKFINHSIVAGFGDLIIQKEIIDSEVTISGACQNPAGHIISSKISAKQGIDAGKIGTSSSKPALLKIGVDEHIQKRIQKIDGRLEKSLDLFQELKEKIKLIETQDQGLYGQITQKAQIQEKAQNETKEITQAIPFLTKDNDVAGLQKATLQIKKLSETAETAKQELNKIFGTQDLYAKQIEQLKEQLNHIERQNKTYVLEKKGLKEFADKTPPLPRLLINGKITQDTAIQGPNSSITLRDDLSRSQIQEKSMMEDGQYFYEMNVSDL
jgi:uncharacterized protein (DUF342 family)/DNA-binding response OmpR family regulator